MDSADCSQYSVTHKREKSRCSISLLFVALSLSVSLFISTCSPLGLCLPFCTFPPPPTPPSHNSSPCALCLTLSCSYLVSFTCFRWLIALSPSWPPFFLLCFCSTLLCSLHIYLLCVLFLPPSLLYASSLYGFLYLYPPEVGEKLWI